MKLYQANMGVMIFDTVSAVVNKMPRVSLEIKSKIKTYMQVREYLPPLNTVLLNLIIVPLQNPLTPSSSNTLLIASSVVVAFAVWLFVFTHIISSLVFGPLYYSNKD